jgi:hypothetical protein
MAKGRPTKPVIPEAVQEDVRRAASDAVRKMKEILQQVNAEAEEFQKRRMQVRERIERGARKTTGRIV